MRLPAILIVAASTSACTHPGPFRPLAYDPSAYRPAKELHDLAPNPVVPALAVGAIVGPVLPALPASPREVVQPRLRVAAANRAALREPTAKGYLDAVQVYPYSQNVLYRLYTAPGQVSDIALQPGENLSAISAGDTVRWSVGDTSSGNGAARQVHVMVKPFSANLKTNLVILTDRRTYHLALESTDGIAMASISWNYSEGLIAKAGEPLSTSVTAAGPDAAIAPDRLQFRYTISGDHPSWRPLRVFDDGHKVYIAFPDRIDEAQAPPLFVIGSGGGSELVNYRVRGNYYVVDQLFVAAELRLGQGRQQVVRIGRSDAERPNRLFAWHSGE